MALAAMAATPGMNLKLIPVGLGYFHPHHFRSRAVIEFGQPIEVCSNFTSYFYQMQLETHS
jgi:glycerol-3-phosphate O-acyltransferase/dihydroxyacetone phosphate acyltransferase